MRTNIIYCQNIWDNKRGSLKMCHLCSAKAPSPFKTPGEQAGNSDEGRCCTIRLRRDLGRFPSPPSRHHGVGLLPAELGHPVEDAAPDHGLSRLRDVVPRLQAASEY